MILINYFFKLLISNIKFNRYNLGKKTKYNLTEKNEIIPFINISPIFRYIYLFTY